MIIIKVALFFFLVIILAQALQFRLQRFDNKANDGIPEMFYNVFLGALDIEYSPHSRVADLTSKALCKSMGYGYVGFASRTTGHNVSNNNVLVWNTSISCSQSQTYAEDCINVSSVTLTNGKVSRILHCYALEISEIRLVDGVVPSEGLLEVKISERWGAVQYQGGFNDKDELDDMICQTLGYIEESQIQPERHDIGYTILTIEKCFMPLSVGEMNSKCSLIGGSRDWLYDMPKEINCRVIRLVNGSSPLQGRVEAGLFGKLQTICGLGFDVLAANVTCTSLGYGAYLSFNTKTTHGVGNLALYSKRIMCNGTELSLEHCSHSPAIIESCSKEYVVSVVCKGGSMKLETFSEARPYEGVLTASYYGHSYYVTTNVSKTTAQTLCSMLGFGAVGSAAISRQAKNWYYYTTNLSCRGNENYIEECSSSFQYCVNQARYNCVRYSRLALFCSDYDIQSISLLDGVLKVTVNNVSWSICEDNFNRDTADSVCMMLGYLKSSIIKSEYVKGGINEIIGSLICEERTTNTHRCNITYSHRLLVDFMSPCEHRITLTCSEECINGFYGPDCSSKCVCDKYNTQSCNKETGACICKQGWSGLTCNHSLITCKTSSEMCIEPLKCLNSSGAMFCRCPEGMYMEDKSKCTACSNNTYGFECQPRCSCNRVNTKSYHMDQICNPFTGTCLCNPYWTGSTCDSDINECIAPVCQENNTVCENKEVGYRCICKDGFMFVKYSCVQTILTNTNVTTEDSKLVVIVTISSVIGGFIIIVVIVFLFWRARQHVGQSDRERKSGQTTILHSNNPKLPTNIMKKGNKKNANMLADHSVYNVIENSENPYHSIKDVHVSSDGYIEFTSALNDHYDSLPDEGTSNSTDPNKGADRETEENNDSNNGYLTPINRNVDIYQKCMSKGELHTDEYLRIQHEN